MISGPSAAWTLAGAALIFASAWYLNRLKMIIPMKRFIALVVLITAFCLFVHAALWIYITLLITAWFMGTGIVTGSLLRRYGLLDLEADWHGNTPFSFVGRTMNISLTLKKPETSPVIKKIKEWLKHRGELLLEGSDSNHYAVTNETERSSFPLAYTDDSELNHFCEVEFILRGHDSGSSLYMAYQFVKPWSYILPWQQRLKLTIPDITILSSGFASFAGINIPPKKENEKNHPIRRESRLQTESFLHIGEYSTGEPLARLDFKTGLRLNQLVSRKYSETIELRCLVALGLGRRARAARSTELLLSRLGRVLAENASSRISSDLVIFDLAKRYEKQLGYNPRKILEAGRELSFINASYLEEDEFVLTEIPGRRIRDYTWLRLIVSWGGRIDLTRTLEAASLYKKNGVRVEVTVIAPELLDVLEKNRNSSAAVFFLEMMKQNQHKAEKAGIRLNWLPE